MKKRVFSWALSLSLLLALSVPALAAAEPEPTPEPEYRLAKVVSQGLEYIFTYGQGGYLPTEILENGAAYVTAAYDEDGRVTAIQENGSSETFVYDEAGNCVHKEKDVSIYSTVNDYTYDEAGNCIRDEYTFAFSDGRTSTSVTEYEFDEDGNRVRSEETGTGTDGGTYSEATEYTYDEDGNCVREECNRTFSDGTVSASATEYTYDEEGRVLNEVITDDEKTINRTNDYREDGSIETTGDDGGIYVDYKTPLLDVYWNKFLYYLDDGTQAFDQLCQILLEDNASGATFFQTGFKCDSEPTLTYDDNGYLVRVDGAAGNYIELTYEPVA